VKPLGRGTRIKDATKKILLLSEALSLNGPFLQKVNQYLFLNEICEPWNRKITCRLRTESSETTV
jgi:hypothetical protein